MKFSVKILDIAKRGVLLNRLDARSLGVLDGDRVQVINPQNGTSVAPAAAEDYVGNFTTLNFGSLNPDLAQWNRTYTLTNNTTTWRYFPSQLLNFDMRIERKNVTMDYVATYGYNATISVPGVGRAQGRAILVELGTGQTEWVMAAIVILAIVSAIIVQVLFRNRKKRLARFQKR